LEEFNVPRNPSVKRAVPQTNISRAETPAKVQRRVEMLVIMYPSLKRYFLSPDGRATAVYTRKRKGSDIPDYWWTTHARNGKITGGSTEGYRNLSACLKNYDQPQPVHVFGCIHGSV
jgi:hypothetical protein